MVLNVPLIGVWVKLLQVPYRYLFPSALFFIAVGVFSTQNSLFQIWEVLAFGVIGAVLMTLEFSVAPILLGFVLGPMVEENFRRALLLSRGDLMVFVQRPISAWFIGASALLILLQVWAFLRRGKARTSPKSRPRPEAVRGGWKTARRIVPPGRLICAAPAACLRFPRCSALDDPLCILFACPLHDPDAWVPRLQAAMPGCRISVWDPESPPSGAEAALVWRPPAELFAHEQGIRTLFNLGAGVDALLKMRDSAASQHCAAGRCRHVGADGGVRAVCVAARVA